MEKSVAIEQFQQFARVIAGLRCELILQDATGVRTADASGSLLTYSVEDNHRFLRSNQP